MASIPIPLTAHTNPPSVLPTETYHSPCSPTAPIKLRIATGGAGQSGLIKALADAFIVFQVPKTQCAPFSVSWLKSDTSASFNYLAQNAADVSITYHAAAEGIALQQGVAERREAAWQDHLMLVGPRSNPAGLPLPSTLTSTSITTTIQSLFSTLFIAASSSQTSPPTRFLSRYDRSATNIAESHLWTSIGQTPWADPPASWYHRYPSFPFQALEAAAKLEEYTLVDRGTWWGVGGWVRAGMVVFMEGRDEDENDELLNPASLLVGRGALNGEMANAFADWMVRADGGQQVVRGFAMGGVVLYTVAKGGEDAGGQDAGKVGE